MKQVILKLQLSEKIYEQYFNYCMEKSNNDKNYAMAMISTHIENMMKEYIKD